MHPHEPASERRRNERHEHVHHNHFHGFGGHHHGAHESLVEGHLRFGIAVNLLFALLEVAIGFVSNSVAILTDAIHDLGDSASLFISLVAAKLSKRPADEQRSFGYRRASILAALVNASILLVATGFVVVHAVRRLFEPAPVESGYMFLVAALSILVNGAAVLRMRKDRERDLNLESAFWHLMEDAIGGVTLLVGGALIALFGWVWVDSLLGLLLGALVLRGAWRVLAKSVNILLEGTPSDIDLAAVERSLLEHPAVESVHHLHIWAMDTNHYNMSVHVRLKEQAIPPNLYGQLSEAVAKFKVAHLTVQVEDREGMCLPCR